ncbi:tetratricopeptide repeat protein [Uliginosibacterium paludis]|uniref:protein O-GlcNAc transferase n=1 Tax=Uliginosibacterium paludis TaxID=1615952 RepID=A0ABV2CUP8_9RHOO
MQKLSPHKLQELKALLDQGMYLLRGGDAAAACYAFEAAEKLAPREFDILHMHGVALSMAGRHAQAEPKIGLAIRLKPDSGRARLNYAVALSALGRRNEALPHLREAVRRLPADATAWYNLANTLRDSGQPGEAETCYRKARELAPANPDVINNLANLLDAQDALPEAAALVAELLQSGSRLPWLHGRQQNLMARQCDWTEHEARAQRLLAAVEAGEPAATPFSLFSLPATPAQQLQAARTRARHEYPLQAPLYRGEQYAHDRIRLAYLSADMHEHATAYLMAGLFEQHDRSRFEVFIFAFNSPGGDQMRERLSRAVEHFIDVSDLDDEAAARLLRKHEIDIAVDLKGYTRDARTGILAFRPAPIQVNYLGYPGSMGADFIDYIVADSVLIPEGSEADYSEKILRLPRCYQPNDRLRPIAHEAGSRQDHGLPDNAFVFCCFNNNFKITPDVFDVWMRLLAGVPGSVLWLFEDNPHVVPRLRAEAEKRGITGERIHFAARRPLAEHLARHRHADLFIDTFHCNAHTTTSDALWAGLPVVTLAGQTFAARVAASLLEACGLQELVTQSPADYEALCLELARNPARLRAIRERLRAQRDELPLFDTAGYTRELESAWTHIHDRWQAGLPPAHITLTH